MQLLFVDLGKVVCTGLNWNGTLIYANELEGPIHTVFEVQLRIHYGGACNFIS